MSIFLPRTKQPFFQHMPAGNQTHNTRHKSLKQKAFVLNFLQISFIHSSHLCSHSNVPLSFPNGEPRVFWSTEMTAIPKSTLGKGEITQVFQDLWRVLQALLTQMQLPSPDWSRPEGYPFSPFSLRAAVLKKVSQYGEYLVLVAPVWQAQPWWRGLLNLFLKNPVIIVIIPSEWSCILSEKPPSVSKDTPFIYHISGINIKQKDFQKTLPEYFSQPLLLPHMLAVSCLEQVSSLTKLDLRYYRVAPEGVSFTLTTPRKRGSPQQLLKPFFVSFPHNKTLYPALLRRYLKATRNLRPIFPSSKTFILMLY